MLDHRWQAYLMGWALTWREAIEKVTGQDNPHDSIYSGTNRGRIV
jgi:hypothetical protein